jgi:hypothetical protein
MVPACSVSLSAGELGVTINGIGGSHYPDTEIVSWSAWSSPTSFTTDLVPYAAFGLNPGWTDAGLSLAAC